MKTDLTSRPLAVVPQKNPCIPSCRGSYRRLAVSYFRMGSPTLSSALNGFTSEFGMVSGGSRSPWPPGKTELDTS